ncbi:beta-lactamase/transpeptidase-like protein [Cercophora scortea]|uniref:Beta-lactamase/transpeptidase-like protein n=1 Tax=Cercophora scortea TaxID=314031 RepID=A0AAE0MHV9_9PEZI|nr:beta-lactamase/transpeptidase-like protein [Cercophora scortea]
MSTSQQVKEEDDLAFDGLLQHLRPTIENLFAAYGNVGGSIGVLKDGHQSFLDIGRQGIGNSEPEPDSITIYLISSMTKPIVALAMFILINDGQSQLSLDTPLMDVFPELVDSPTNFLQYADRHLNMADLLDLRSTFLTCTNLWESLNGEIPWQTIDPILSLLRELPANEEFIAGDFRHKRNYSNECFALASAVIERKTGIPWTSFVHKKIFEPLGMDRTFAAVPGVERLGGSVAFSKSHSARVEGTLQAVRSYSFDQTPSFRATLRLLQSEAFVPPEPVEVSPSQASWASDTGASTPMGEAAGIMSCTRDLLKFYRKFIDVYHMRAGKQSREGFGQLTEVERGMAAMQDLIGGRDPSCTYASGWNRVIIPSALHGDGLWSRWPGADGGNAPRVEKAIDEDHNRDKTRPGCEHADARRLEVNLAWLFLRDVFQRDRLDDGSSLALYHGGNMVGATSFCFLIPASEIAVVVLCNTRGFFLDAANLTCMLLTDIIFDYDVGGRSSGTRLARAFINESCRNTRTVAAFIAAQYISELVHYESRLANEYEIADPVQYASCVGTYQLTDGIFAVVSEGKVALEFQLYGKGFKYPMRVKVREPLIHSKSSGVHHDEKQVVMTFAIPMADLVPTGVGGSNRLDVDDFKIIFKRFNELGVPGEFTWDFSRHEGGRREDIAFRRVHSFC